MRASQEEGVSNALALVILFSVAIAGFGSAFAWAATLNDEEYRPSRHVTLASEGPLEPRPAGTSKNFSVTTGTPEVWYADYRIELDHQRVPCLQEFGTEDAWRLWSGGRPLPCDDANVAPHRMVTAGDVIEIWDAGTPASLATVTPKPLKIVDVLQNDVVATTFVR